MDDDLSLLIDAAKASGEIARKYWRNSPDVWEKPDGTGPVTEADLEIDTMLHAELLAQRPDFGWLSEETEDSLDRQSHESVFIIDPIDGTRAFMNQAPTFSHSLAIARSGEITAGVVYLPMLDRLYSATNTGIARLNGEEIQSSVQSEIDGATCLAAKSNFTENLWIGDVPKLEPHIRSSLAYRLCLVAQGRFDTMLTLRDTWEWDVAAGSLIAIRAGSVVTTQDGAAPIFNNRVPKLHGLVAAPKPIHGDIIARLAPR